MGRFWSFAIGYNRPNAAFHLRLLSADSVEKVDLLPGLRQNQVIGQREDSQHDGTIVERTRETVILVFFNRIGRKLPDHALTSFNLLQRHA